MEHRLTCLAPQQPDATVYDDSNEDAVAESPWITGLRWFEGKLSYKLVPTARDIIQQELSLKGTFPFKEIYWDLSGQDGIPEMGLNGILFHAVWYSTQSASPNQDIYAQNGVSY